MTQPWGNTAAQPSLSQQVSTLGSAVRVLWQGRLIRWAGRAASDISFRGKRWQCGTQSLPDGKTITLKIPAAQPKTTKKESWICVYQEGRTNWATGEKLSGVQHFLQPAPFVSTHLLPLTLRRINHGADTGWDKCGHFLWEARRPPCGMRGIQVPCEERLSNNGEFSAEAGNEESRATQTDREDAEPRRLQDRAGGIQLSGCGLPARRVAQWDYIDMITFTGSIFPHKCFIYYTFLSFLCIKLPNNCRKQKKKHVLDFMSIPCTK